MPRFYLFYISYVRWFNSIYVSVCDDIDLRPFSVAYFRLFKDIHSLELAQLTLSLSLLHMVERGRGNLV